AALPGALQLVAALALLGGTWTRPAALAIGVLKVLPGLALPAAGDPQQAIDLARSLLLGGALALLAAYGPGDFSLDAWRRGRTGGSYDPHMNPGGALRSTCARQPSVTTAPQASWTDTATFH